jgi:hypothetical protein
MSTHFVRLVLLFTSLFAASLLQSQSNVFLTGTLVDATTDEPLPFATVVIHQTQDSAMIANGLTELDGAFRIAIPPGSYYAALQFIGYADEYIDGIQVSGTEGSVVLGLIRMGANLPGAKCGRQRRYAAQV